MRRQKLGGIIKRLVDRSVVIGRHLRLLDQMLEGLCEVCRDKPTALSKLSAEHEALAAGLGDKRNHRIVLEDQAADEDNLRALGHDSNTKRTVEKCCRAANDWIIEDAEGFGIAAVPLELLWRCHQVFTIGHENKLRLEPRDIRRELIGCRRGKCCDDQFGVALLCIRQALVEHGSQVALHRRLAPDPLVVVEEDDMESSLPCVEFGKELVSQKEYVKRLHEVPIDSVVAQRIHEQRVAINKEHLVRTEVSKDVEHCRCRCKVVHLNTVEDYHVAQFALLLRRSMCQDGSNKLQEQRLARCTCGQLDDSCSFHKVLDDVDENLDRVGLVERRRGRLVFEWATRECDAAGCGKPLFRLWGTHAVLIDMAEAKPLKYVAKRQLELCHSSPSPWVSCSSYLG